MGIHKNRKTVAVFIPCISGFYFTNVVSLARQEAIRRQLDLIVVVTGSFDRYDSLMALDYIDAAYISLNAVSSSFIDTLTKRQIPVITSSNNYAHQDVEPIVSHHVNGIQQAFEHLYQLGHRKIGFAGDLNVVDMRVRYEGLLECYRQKEEQFHPQWLYSIHDACVNGGTEAAEAFLEAGSPCSAIICASDLIAIGLEKHLTTEGLSLPQDLALIGIDNTLFGEEFHNCLTSVDQRIDLLIQASFDRIEARLGGSEFNESPLFIKQELKVRESCGNPYFDPSLESKPVKDPVAQAMTENSESTMALAKLNYHWLTELSKLWGPFLQWGCMAHWEKEQKLTDPSSLSKRINEMHISDVFLGNDQHLELPESFQSPIPVQSFPPLNLPGVPQSEQTLLTLLPICPEGIHWGVLTIVDELRADMNHDTYDMFYYYVELVSFFMQQQALADSMHEREHNAKELTEKLSVVANATNDGFWTWEISTNTLEWNSRLLDMLGYHDPAEQHIHQDMSLLERIHPMDRHYVQTMLHNHLEFKKPFKIRFRIQNKFGNFLWVESNGEAIRDNNGHATRFIGTMNDITEQHHSNKRIEFMAYHDALTGLPNRAALSEKIEDLLYNHQNKPFALILLGLNRFKSINDSFGHHTGDEILKHVAHNIKKVLRKHDFLSRFEGDEFIILCEVHNDKESLLIANRILSSLEGYFDHEQTSISISASLGISYYPKHATTLQALLTCADLALHQAKKLQSHHPVMYEESMDCNLKDKVAMENQLRQAIQEDELYLAFQSQIDCKTEQLIGAEALCRWQSPKFGEIPPYVFIALAEETGLIQPLGDWVLIKALETLKDWQDRDIKPIKLSINVSAAQLQDPNFQNAVIEKVHSYKIDPKNLCLEITESTAINEMEHTHKQLIELSNIGLEISLDDFGTGYSSLHMLNELPVQWVKIDRSFIKEIATEDIGRGMVKSIAEMCHSLGYKVIAEGVETHHQRDIIQAIGCDLIQGYYYSPPIPLEAFEHQYLQNNQFLTNREQASS